MTIIQDKSPYEATICGLVLFTGLPASGKSSIANRLKDKLSKLKINSSVLDGDKIRCGINSDLGFSRKDRKENLRRVAEISKILIDAGQIVLAAFVSPYEEDRKLIQKTLMPHFYLEVYVKCPIAICEERDNKGNYQKAKKGFLKNFTGVNSPFEEPLNPDAILETNKMSVSESSDFILGLLVDKGYLNLSHTI